MDAPTILSSLGGFAQGLNADTLHRQAAAVASVLPPLEGSPLPHHPSISVSSEEQYF